MLEYVPGETLKGPLPVDEALAVATQMAEAMEEAHGKGIVHRDLKPPNIKITPDGKVKVLDFGLAKALADDSFGEFSANSPTVAASALTRGGMLLGTAAYMSPEQARGKRADKRTDIWAFGCVLYEMLTGRQVFGGETISDCLAALLKNEPDWSRLPAETPANVTRLLRLCLEKDPSRRLRDIGDAWIRTEVSEPGRPPGPLGRGRWLPWAAAALFALAASVSIGLLVRAPKPTPRPVTRLSTPVPPRSFGGFLPALSPDGTLLAFVAGTNSQIYIRQMNEFEAKPLPGTENSSGHFFSLDGRWLAFHSPQERKLKKVPVIGGTALTLCDMDLSGALWLGGSWGADGVIIVPLGGGAGLSRVSAAGGTPELLTKLDGKRGETSHRFPQILPGGQAVIFSAGARGSFDDARITLLSLKTGEQRDQASAPTFDPGLSTSNRSLPVASSFTNRRS